MTPKALVAGKRGSALLVMVLFLATSFTVYNKMLFGGLEDILAKQWLIVAECKV